MIARIATYLRTMPPSVAGAEQRLYRCDPPMEGNAHVIVSKVVVRVGHPLIDTMGLLLGGFYGPGAETFAFPADEAGAITNWSELPCSMKGDHAHEDVLREAGYAVAEVAS